MAQRLKRLPAMRETWVRPLGWEDPLEKEMATHSSILAWRIPWTEEPGRLQSMGSQRVGYDFTFTFPSLSVSCLCENLPSCFIGYLLGVPSFLESGYQEPVFPWCPKLWGPLAQSMCTDPEPRSGGQASGENGNRYQKGINNRSKYFSFLSAYLINGHFSHV